MTTYKVEVNGVKVEFDADLSGLVNTIDALEKRDAQKSSAPDSKDKVASKVATGHPVDTDNSPDMDGSLRDKLRSLIEEGFFNEYQPSVKVQSRLAELGYKIELQSISSRLGRLYKPKSKNTKPELTRKKIGINKYAYKVISEDDTAVVPPTQPTTQQP